LKDSIAIIGAGPAGITAAYELAKGGRFVEVYEAGPEVGGLARTIKLWNQKVDVGPHRFFSTDHRVNSLWMEVVNSDYHMVDRLTRIFYNGRFFHYPLKPLDALSKLGPVTSLACMASYLKTKFDRKPPGRTFESWVESRFGRRLFEIFFKSYSEKLWGIPCDELDSDFASQRIKKLSLGEVVLSMLNLSSQRHKTLVDQFAYPIEGTGIVYERMASHIRKLGGIIHTSTPVEKILLDGHRVTGLVTDEGSVHHHSKVISTMPLTQLVSRLPDNPPEVVEACDSLRFRNTIIVYLLIKESKLFPDNWVYIHASDLHCGRITNFRNWVPELYGSETSSILAMEYWCNTDDPEWTGPDSAMEDLAREEIMRSRLAENITVLDAKVLRIPKCYPVYKSGYQDHIATISDHLQKFEGIQVIGRYGSFKYNNQDHSILMGLLAAENILKNARNDLWSINTDYDNYQEKSLITATGLCKSDD
jgi:protoporphyrinogen oxidase